MGRERNRTRKYLHLSIAGMIFMILVACATLKELKAEREASKFLDTAQKLFDQGDYEGALGENQKVLSLFDHVPPGDQALFNTGLIYVHYGYPKRDYKKSLDTFKKLVEAFPQSPLVGQAKIWIGILRENEKLKRETEELNKSIKKSQQESERLNREIEELNKTLKKSKQVDIEIEEKKKEISK